MKYKPKPHQAKAIESVFSHNNGLNNNNRTQMIMACGTVPIIYNSMDNSKSPFLQAS